MAKQNRFKQAKKDMVKRRERAAKMIGMFVEAEAKLRAPVRTGHLRRSITNEVKNEKDKSIVSVGSNVEYAAVVELGSVIKNITAQPFISPAILDNISRLNEILKSELKVK